MYEVLYPSLIFAGLLAPCPFGNLCLVEIEPCSEINFVLVHGENIFALVFVKDILIITLISITNRGDR